MKGSKLFILWISFLAIWTTISGLYIVVYKSNSVQVDSYTYPDVFPELVAQSLTGEQLLLNINNIDIGSDHFILYMLSDDECQYCHRALPELERYSLEYLVTTVVLWRGTMETIRGFISQFPNITYHYFFDFDQLYETELLYGGTPQYFLVDQKQRILYSSVGFNFRLAKQPLEEFLINNVGVRSNGG